MPLHRGGSHCAAEEAAHHARPPAKVSPPVKLPVLDERLCISSSKVRPLVSVLHDVPIDLAVAQSPGPPRRRRHPALVTWQPSKVRHHHSPRRKYMTTTLTGCAGGTFSPLKLSSVVSSSTKPRSILKKGAGSARHLVWASWRTNLPYAEG